MKTEAFLLCDAATNQQGKLNVLGAFDNIFARQAPVVHSACAIACRIRFDRSEEGEHAMTINVIDMDGKDIMPPMNGKINVRIGPDVESNAVNLILNVQGMRLEKYGEYQIDLSIDGRHQASLPFYVRQFPERTAHA
jgi:hypothetical protein